jgi:glycosyltransferase involved in cell wall biosynthesis
MNFRRVTLVFFSKTKLVPCVVILYRIISKSRRNFLKKSEIKYVNWKPKSRIKNLFLDISSLVFVDHGGGIQRVQKSLVENWSIFPPKEFRVVPIYFCDSENQFKYANREQVPSWNPSERIPTNPVEMAQGDYYLNTDLNYKFVIKHEEFYKALQKNRINIYFMVYDLLPLTLPNFFPEGISEFHKKWFEFAARNAKLISISNTVANEIRAWGTNKQIPIQVATIHLGSNLIKNPISVEETFVNVKQQPPFRFLMVGTLEPRKGHDQVLSAFEILWRKGTDATLTFVGKKGWKVEDLLSRIETHEYFNKKLFWLSELDDIELVQTYKNSTALINASFGEGLGLPIVEASAYGLPLILRDLPVFNEIAGENAWYFETRSDLVLADSIMNWIGDYSHGEVAYNRNVRIYSWQETCNQITDIFTEHGFK